MPANATQVHRSAIFLTISRSGRWSQARNFLTRFVWSNPRWRLNFKKQDVESRYLGTRKQPWNSRTDGATLSSGGKRTFARY